MLGLTLTQWNMLPLSTKIVIWGETCIVNEPRFHCPNTMTLRSGMECGQMDGSWDYHVKMDSFPLDLFTHNHCQCHYYTQKSVASRLQ